MIWIIVLLGFILRTYRISDFMGFWYDQGRDGLTIWNLIHHGKFFLIGPTTGIEGIFLGPFYYYLITPFYALGQGSPVYPAIFLAGLNCAAIYLVYRITKKFAGNLAGLAAATFYAFSFQLIGASRWLSNPTPLPFFALLAIWSLVELVHSSKKTRVWALLGLAVGLSLQLEAASATFFLPVTIIALLVYRQDLIFSARKLFALLGFFGLTLLPQILFNIRNQNILLRAFYTFLFSEKSFQPTVTNFYQHRVAFYYEIFTNKFFLDKGLILPSVLAVLVMAIVVRKKLPNKFIAVLLLWWFTPVIILLFYHGNHGYVWDYYFTGVFPIICILLGSILAIFLVNVKSIGRFLPLVILVIFLAQNLSASKKYYLGSGGAFITLTWEKAAVDWMYQDTGKTPFNTDEYVPPMIPYAYQYLLLWRGQQYGVVPKTELVKRLYTLHEPDTDHQTLLNTWMTRQAGIGSIEKTKEFGSLTVERRVRFDVNAK